MRQRGMRLVERELGHRRRRARTRGRFIIPAQLASAKSQSHETGITTWGGAGADLEARGEGQAHCKNRKWDLPWHPNGVLMGMRGAGQ